MRVRSEAVVVKVAGAARTVGGAKYVEIIATTESVVPAEFGIYGEHATMPCMPHELER